MSTVVIGVISDTHGLLRPEALATLAGSDYIVHAGDIGDPGILDKLNQLAPVTAVRGNVDRGQWAARLPPTNTLQVDEVLLYMLHNLAELNLKPEAAGFSVVIYGHSHLPKQEMRNGVLYFNPGSAGPRRFQLPVTLGKLRLREHAVKGEILNLAD
jgi:putative phosphoesterase